MTIPDTIEDIYAIVCIEADGSEGIPAFGPVNGMMMPMVGADKERIDSLIPTAKEISRETGMPMKLVRYIKLTEENIEA